MKTLDTKFIVSLVKPRRPIILTPDYEPKPLHFQNPAWLSDFQFFSHRELDPQTKPTLRWRVTEVSTGLAIPGVHVTRFQAIKTAKEKMLERGEEFIRKMVADHGPIKKDFRPTNGSNAVHAAQPS